MEDHQDTAGKLLGWSLAAGMEQKRIHDLVQFPCVFCFKAIGSATTGFVQTMLDRVAGVLGRAVTAEEHSVRSSARGAYASVTLQLWVTDGDQVYSIYEAMRADDRVKYLL
jgi:putative lipoic acid-binding regulatory protein